jgi:MFS transporter, MHS family, alpha-ketoglutarate permease
VQRPSRIRSIVGGSLGNLVEWYDWFSYAAFALYFAKSFFPQNDPTAQLLNTSGIFALGFLMRPVGAWLLGVIADRRGRKTALVWSVTLMCAGSAIIAITPGYATIGVAAPIVLVVARMLQGLSVGGEFGASATYLAEIAEPEHRGYWASYQYVTMMLGQLLALAVLLLLQYVVLGEAQLDAWGWRIPFAIGALLAIVVYYVRRTIAETPDFLHAPRKRSIGVREMLRHRRPVLLVFGMAIGSNVAFYAFTTYMQKYLVASAGFPRNRASLICSIATVIFVIAQPLAGALSDRIGRKPLLLWFGVLGTVGTVPLMTAIGGTRDPFVAFALVLVVLLILCGTTSVSATAKAEMFPPEIRALGVGFPYAISTSIFADAEYVAFQFKSAGHETGFFWYVSACIAVSLIAILFVPETRWSSHMASTSEPAA